MKVHKNSTIFAESHTAVAKNEVGRASKALSGGDCQVVRQGSLLI